MKIGSIRYLIGEGIKNTWANRLMTIASVGVLVACMVIIGLAILIIPIVEIVKIFHRAIDKKKDR